MVSALTVWTGYCCDNQFMGGSEKCLVLLKNKKKKKKKKIEQGSIKLKELHVCIMRVQKKMAAWRSEVP